jgi:tetratricopeptide (TPR) repeat protein
MPTVLDLLGVAAPPGLDGRSLRAPPPANPRPLYIENLSTQVLHGWAPLLGVRRDDYKFIHAPKPEIYDLRNDPGETKNLFDTRPVLAAEMQAQLRAFVGDDPYMGTAAQQNLPLDAETEELLRSLGYVFTTKDTAPATPDSYQLDPKDMVVHWEKVQTAVHQHMQGEVTESIRGLEQALAEVPEDIWARHVLSSAYNTYGEYEKAYDMIASIEQRQPDDAGTVAAVGSALLQLRRVEEAERKLERALELDPRSGPARLGLAQIAQMRRDEVRALALLHEVIEIDPGSSGPAAYAAIGRLKLRKRELEPAREAFRAALEIDRMHAGAYSGLANVLIEEGRPDAALPHLETALRFQPAQPGTLTTLAQIHRDRGDLERAIELSEQALEMSPKFAAAYNNLGRIYRKRGEDQTAFEMYERAIEYAPRFDAAHVNRAQLLLAGGHEDEAIDAFREAARVNPFNYIALANLGVREFKDGALRKAAALFGRAIRVREDYALAHKYLGLLRAEQGDPAASVRHLERSLEIDDAQPEVEKMRFLLGEMKQRVTRGS